MKAPVSAAVAIAFGLLVLAGYFIDLPVFTNLREIFLRYAVILAAVMLLVGVANLFTVHWRKMSDGESGGVYSLLLIVSLLVTAVLTILYGPTGYWPMWIFNNIQLPVETSLMAVLAVALVFASIRLLSRRRDWFSVLFLGTAVLTLLGTVPLFGVEIPMLYGPEGLRTFLAHVLAMAGARGILLGVALGTVATGLRILIGADRPYGG